MQLIVRALRGESSKAEDMKIHQPHQKIMMLTFDRATYSSLLAEVAPKVIETEDEYDRLLVIAERPWRQGMNSLSQS